MRLTHLLVLLTASAALGQQPETVDINQAMRDLGAATQTLGRGDRAGALRKLELIIPTLPENSLPRHTAQLLRDQMVGRFAERQKLFLQRQVVDTVVLVPDEVSFIEAVKAWPADRFWPVLIEDAWYAPLFIEAFKPRHVARFIAPSRPAESMTPEDRSKQVTAIAARAMGEHIRATAPRVAAEAPAGIVVVDPTSPQRSAALALAIGRFQPILALTSTSAEMTTAREPEVTELNDRILRAMGAVRLLATLDWSGITLAGRFPIRYNAAADTKSNPLSVDDRLGRDERQVRRGVVGRISGNLTQSVYTAMCSMFLQPSHALLVHTYGYSPETALKDVKHGYHLTHAAESLKRMMTTKLLQTSTATLSELRREAGPGHPYDFFWINSAGGGTDQLIGGGPMDGDDMPIGRAGVIYHVASWGLTDPWNGQTMAQKGMQGGAFWYFGSTHEPYLQAFVQSTEAAARMTPGTPLAFPVRHVPGHPFYRPWKLMLLGDPLLAFRDEAAKRGESTVPGAVEVSGGPGGDMTPGARLAQSLFTRRETVETAKAVIGSASALTPAELGSAMRVLYDAKETQLVVRAVPEGLAARHLIASVILRRVLREEMDAALKARRITEAQAPLARAAVTAGMDEGEMARWCTRYLEAAGAAQQRDPALSYLRLLSKQSGVTPLARAGIEAAVRKAEGK